MFVHIGGETVLPVKDIVAILDIGNLENKATRDFIQISEEEGFVERNDIESERSFVLTNENIYFSPISSATLKKRIENLSIYQDNLSLYEKDKTSKLLDAEEEQQAEDEQNEHNED